mgnify:CR=1 FL=1
MSSGNSFVVLKTLNDTILEGSIVEPVSVGSTPDINIVLGIGLNEKKFVTDTGLVFSVTGTSHKIESCFEQITKKLIPQVGQRTLVREQGKRGPVGEQGQQGQQGSVGPVGLQGVPGELGPQGPVGERGFKGSRGNTGENGVGVKSVESLDQKTILIHLTDRSVFSADLPKGPPGFNGIQGEQGVTGSVGERGENGKVGPQGEKGDSGDRGPIGKAGVKGKAGTDGKDGAVGEAGPRGEKGTKGTKGPKGDSGKQGVPGPVGSVGPKGAQGPEGNQGQKGAIGKRGTEGKSGVVRARFPLKYDEKKQELTFDAKSLERVLSVNNFDPMAVNNLLTAIGGGGAVGIRHDGSMIIKSVSDINITRGLEILPKGKNVELQLDTEVPFSFAGITTSDKRNHPLIGTGDFWFDTSDNAGGGKLYFRVDDNWVEV